MPGKKNETLDIIRKTSRHAPPLAHPPSAWLGRVVAPWPGTFMRRIVRTDGLPETQDGGSPALWQTLSLTEQIVQAILTDEVAASGPPRPATPIALSRQSRVMPCNHARSQSRSTDFSFV